MSRQDVIVVAVDGSDASKVAVTWAANTALKRGVPLRLVSAYSMPQFLYAEGMLPPQELYDDLESETMEKIEEARKIALDFAPELEVTHQIEEGSPIDLLLDLSAQCTMIVMGSRGLGGLSGMVMGSVSAAVVSHAECPVVVVREDNILTEATKYGPVVVGVDGSNVSQRAVEFAFIEAAARKSKLIAVHTWMDMQVQSSLAGLAAAQQQWQVVEDEQRRMLSDRLAYWESKYPEVEVEKIVTRDRPVRALGDAAEGAQLLVVGSHGRGGFKGMLLGSTSRALLQAAPCPMMVVRPDSEDKKKPKK
ncbi:universal stress protein [Corynebacterium ulceribovis]|uniref:universal stress protein n=1 Tax=Corynebacterium ulceribovis TaxID=487732 RepID=UPI000370EB7E|nr:universal stress protein [Corynebacterium ulceribovis]